MPRHAHRWPAPNPTARTAGWLLLAVGVMTLAVVLSLVLPQVAESFSTSLIPAAHPPGAP